MKRKILYFNFVLLQLFIFLYVAYSYLFAVEAYPTVIFGCMIIETVSSFYFILELNRLYTKELQYWKEKGRLERLNLLGQMSAAIAHEVKNPLTTVRGFLQIFKQREKYMNDLENINLLISELDRANKIINDFLSISKAEQTSESNVCKINQLINEIFPLIQAQAFDSDKGVSLKLEDNLNNYYVFINKDEFKQVLFNLIKNALEASPKRKVIKIKTYKKNDCGIISIEDKGSGIPPEIREKIGTPFFTTKENGTGLGLSVCYNIIQKYRGKIDFETDEKGTTFYVQLPVTE